MSRELLDTANTLILGAGTAGCTLAGLLTANSSDTVVLVDAGPDYGAASDGRWPAELRDARVIPLSHDWELSTGDLYSHRVLDFPRARVVGGCSAHNGCTAALGARIDYDQWAQAGNDGWSSDELEPLLELARNCFRVRPYTLEELTAPQAAFVQAGQDAGLPLADDLDRLEAGVGIGPMTANIVNGVRWNAAFAFLDPVRHLPHLQVCGDTLVDRLLLDRDRVLGAQVLRDGVARDIHAERVVLCAGAYGTPTILMRSGIGPAQESRRLGLDPVVDLQGVGSNLLDHVCVQLDFAGSEAFERSRSEQDWYPDEQSVGRARSTLCDAGPYDMHVFMVAGANSGHPDLPPISLYGGAMRARSQGTVRLRDLRPNTAPTIDPRYLSDPDGHDRTVLLEARTLLRSMIANPRLATILGPEVERDSDLDRDVVNYCHPAGTCKLGPPTDPASVVGAKIRVHGFENLHVADASLMPNITRGNINLPTAAIAARSAAFLLDRTVADLAEASSALLAQ